MKKVITFSLWGNNPNYNIGAIKNAILAKEYYPDFECWFYIHEESVPKETIEELNKLDNVKIILKTGDLNVVKPAMWRFEAIDDTDVEVMISRDTDSRIYLREKLAVDEWLNSDKLFHIMRDHPCHHFEILAGMFGTKKIPEIPSWIKIMDTFSQNNNYGYDQDFLKYHIYPFIKDNSVIHTSFHNRESHCKNFPIEFDSEYHFVGEYVNHDEFRPGPHINR